MIHNIQKQVFNLNESSIDRNHQKESNYRLLIRMIHADHECSRIRLAKNTGFSQATVTKLVSKLIEWGVVQERENLATPIGRKPIRLKISNENYLLGAIRIARNYVTVGLFTLNGRPTTIRRIDIEKQDVHATMNQICDLFVSLKETASRKILGLGVAVPGPLHIESGTVALMSSFPGWNHINIRECLENKTGLPVFLEHDANCGAIAELWYGGHERNTSLLFVLGDQGVGAGLIINGDIYHGALGYSGEMGHSSINFEGPICECGNRGCIELYSSTLTMRRAYLAERLRTEQSHEKDITTDDFLQLSRENDPIARSIYETAVSQLAFGLVGFINALTPSAVVFSDPITTGSESFLSIIKNIFQKYLMPQIYENLIVSTCSLDADPMLLGASVVAFEQLIQNPSNIFCL